MCFFIFMIKAVMLVILIAGIASAIPVSTGLSTFSSVGMSKYGTMYSTNTPLGSNFSSFQASTLRPVAKTYNNRLPVASSASKFNPNRNVIHSNATQQTWDYLGYCIEQPKSVQLRATKLTCTYQRQDRQLNSWSCVAGGYLRCVGTSCPKNTCRVQGVQVS